MKWTWFIWIPRIKICRELPQWIIPSDKAAYHPATATIYIRRDCLRYIFHELAHHFREILKIKQPHESM